MGLPRSSAISAVYVYVPSRAGGAPCGPAAAGRWTNSLVPPRVTLSSHLTFQDVRTGRVDSRFLLKGQKTRKKPFTEGCPRLPARRGVCRLAHLLSRTYSCTAVYRIS